MDLADRLAQERRARLAAERLLAQRNKDCAAAVARLAQLDARQGQSGQLAVDLAQSEGRLRGLIDALPDGLALYDAAGRLLAVNPAYLAWFAGPGARPGMAYADVLALAHDGGAIDPAAQTGAAWCAAMLARWSGDPVAALTLRLRNGGWLRLDDRRLAGGETVSLVADITDQMRIWAAIEAIPDGFVLFDREERLLTCNQRYRDIYPASAPAMQPGARFEDILRHGLRHGQHNDALGREEAWLADRLDQHRNPGRAAEQQLADGRWIRAQDHATPDGGRVGLRVDITHQKEQQAALETARGAAEAANRAKSAFLANITHEIRTPMNGVVGMADLLCESGLTAEQRLFAETIRSSGEALLVIINDILDYSKIEAERLTLHPEPFDLERLIHEAAMLLQPRALAKGLDLMIDYDVFLATRFIGDAGRLRQVLTNLIGNAVKFTETGHVLIRVVGVAQDQGAQRLHITVEDTGIGIAPENLEAIFDEFNQVDDGANRRFEGTGLGLAITRRLIDRMEGSVWVDSEPGKGSSFGFRLTLPVAEEAVAPHLPRALRHVLVVDDQFINRTILERQLAPFGLRVTLCRSGAEALTALAAAPFDVVLTDDDMPDMDGLALTAQLRARGLQTPVLLLSSNPAQALRRAGAEHLAAAVQKPVLRADLYRHLQALDAPAELRAMRVLLAEDNRTNQLVFQKMVRALDLDLQIAANGREAVALFPVFRPDLIFMDISMPELDGRAAARAIRAMPDGQVPIIALTAHAMEGDAQASLAAGIDRYMTKPLRQSVLVEILAEHCPPDARHIAMPAPHAA